MIELVQRLHNLKKISLLSLVLGILCLFCIDGLASVKVTLEDDQVAAGGVADTVSDVRVVINGPEDLQDTYGYLAKRLIRLHPGDLFDKGDLKASVEALKLSNRFSAIHIDSASEPGGEVLFFTLTPYLTIADIRISGEYPLFERDILNQMTLYPGDPYTSEDLSAQAEAIISRYKREGYVDPKVSIKAQRDTGNQSAVVFVDINKGPHYTLGSLNFKGNSSISSSFLQLRMAVWRAALLPVIGRFSEYQLKKDMTSLVTYYRSKGFADAKLSYNIDDTGNSHQVNVTVQIVEGQLYTVTFEGNRNFWDLTLEKDVVIFSKGNRGNIGVRRSVKNIKKRYREAGFLNTSVEAESTLKPGTPVETRQLRFVIEEGPQTIVDKVTIAGNQSLSADEIKDQILTQPPTIFHNGALVPETLEKDTFAVNTLCLNHGYLKCTVDSKVIYTEDKTGAEVRLDINEGPRTTVHSIGIKGLTVLPEAEVRKVLVQKIGDPYRTASLDSDKDAISSLISEKGYPHVTVQPNISYSQDRTQADIVYHIETGPLVTLGNVFISGNLKTSEKVIQRELEVKTQEPLSLQALYDAQRRLRDMEIFHGVTYRIFGLKEKSESVDLFVEIEENKPYYAQTSGGYQSDSGIFARAKVGDRNLFGLNKDLWLSGEVSETGHRLETRLTEPRLFGSRVSASIGFFNEELTEFNQSFGTTTTGGSLAFGRTLGSNLTTALTFKLEKRDQFSVDGQPLENSADETRTVFVTTPYVRYDSRDSFVRPTKGFLASLSVDLSKGIQNQLDDFVRYQLDARYYWTPLKRLTLASLARVGEVLPYGDSELVPDDQLFYLGGIQSVRGFDENLLRFDSEGKPVGGKTAVSGSLEARIDIGMNLELTTFFDIGSVQNALVDEGSDRFRSSVGLGLRYITPIGPIGLVYGHKLDREEGESAGRINFSIGYSF